MNQILHPDDIDNSNFTNSLYWEQLELKANIIKKYNCKKIAEIGVRYGYSAYKILQENDCEYFGFDMLHYDKTKDHHGGVCENTFPFVENLLKNKKFHLIHQNTQLIDKLGNDFDAIHIDGDHSYIGCLHDLIISYYSLKSKGILLVDDVSFLKEVKRAVCDFLKIFKHQVKSIPIQDIYRGDALILKL